MPQCPQLNTKPLKRHCREEKERTTAKLFLYFAKNKAPCGTQILYGLKSQS